MKNTHRKHMEIWNGGLQVIIGKIFFFFCHTKPKRSRFLNWKTWSEFYVTEKHAISRKDGGKRRQKRPLPCSTGSGTVTNTRSRTF